MHFLTPAAFALAAFIPIIIAMYLLKLRRTEQVVASVYLWRRMVRDVEANAPWQRLRRNLLLILQLLFLTAIILTLARPFTWIEGASGQAAIFILDTSASMASTDVKPNRLEVAKAQARQLVDGLPDDARVTIIAASDGARVLVASGRDRRQIHRAIDGLQTGAGDSDLTAALELASAIAARQPETQVVVLSDGRVMLPDRLALKGHLHYVPVGISGDNQAISVLSLQTAPGGESLTAFAQVANYGEGPAQRRLALYADGQLYNAYDLDIPSQGQRAIVADDLPLTSLVVEARLDGQDALPLDDRAWTVLRNAEPVAVTLITDGNLFLETALSLLSGLQVTTVRPSDFEEGRENDKSEEARISLPSLQPSGLTILDAYTPLTATLPAGNLFFIAPPRSTEHFTVTGIVDQPAPRLVDVADPLLAHVTLDGVSMLDAVRVTLPSWARPVIAGDVTGESTPLLFAGELDGRRLVVLTFDLHRSDLPLQVAFPLLLANLTGWLAPGMGGDLPAHVPPGTAVTVSLPPEVESVTVTRPDGSTARLVPEGGRIAFADTGQLGVYQMTWAKTGQANLAVNLFSPQESDVQPADTLSTIGTGEAEEGEHPRQARREWWRPLAYIALALLTIEWLAYQRPSLARLWVETKQLLARGEGER